MRRIRRKAQTKSDSEVCRLRNPPSHPHTRAVALWKSMYLDGGEDSRERRGGLQRVAEGCRVAQMHLNPIGHCILRHQLPVAARELFLQSTDSLAGWPLTNSEGSVILFLFLILCLRL